MLGDEVIGAWLDDDAFVDGSQFVGDTPEILIEMVRCLRKTAGEQVLTRSGNVIDVRRRFAKR